MSIPNLPTVEFGAIEPEPETGRERLQLVIVYGDVSYQITLLEAERLAGGQRWLEKVLAAAAAHVSHHNDEFEKADAQAVPQP